MENCEESIKDACHNCQGLASEPTGLYNGVNHVQWHVDDCVKQIDQGEIGHENVRNCS